QAYGRFRSRLRSETVEMTRARRRARLLTGFAVMAWLVGGCGGATGESGPTYPRFSYECCAADDMQGWYPGKAITLHWVVQGAGASTDNRDAPITLPATLSGPYPDVTSLKSGAPATVTIRLPTLVADNRVSMPLTSALDLPPDLA